MAPGRVLCAEQVHAAEVARVGSGGELDRGRADAVMSDRGGARVGVVTADCVPILASLTSGRGVVAIHAGWRGLAAGVIGAAIGKLSALGRPGEEIVGVVGPHIGACCYEVDGPVLDALARRFGPRVESFAESSRPGHSHLDLGGLAEAELREAGLAATGIARVEAACTFCNPERFDSYRRQGDRAGRLLHYIITSPP